MTNNGINILKLPSNRSYPFPTNVSPHKMNYQKVRNKAKIILSNSNWVSKDV